MPPDETGSAAAAPPQTAQPSVTASEASSGVAPAGDDDGRPNAVTTERADPGTSPQRAEQIRREAFRAASKGDDFRTPSVGDDDEAGEGDAEPVGTDDRTVGPERGPPRDENGKFLPRKIAPPGTPQATQPRPGQPARQQAELPPAVQIQQREMLMGARRTLMRDGFTAQELDSMQPERIVSIASKRSREQAAIDTAIRRQQISGRDVAPNGVHSQRQAALSPENRLDQFLDELDGEGQQPQATPQNQPTSEPANPLFAELCFTRCENSRNSLQREIPLLADPSVWALVVAKMDRLDPNQAAMKEGPEAITQLVRDAAFVTIGPQLAEQARTQNRARNIAARVGQPDTASIPGEQPARPVTGEDIRAAAFKAAQTSRSPQETRQKMAQLLPGRT